MKKLRIPYLFAAVIIFFIEVYIALYVHDDFIRPYFGDYLVVILMYSFIRAFFNVSVLRVSIFVLLLSYLIETLQYFHILEKLNLQNYHWLAVIMGTSFAWVDILAYTLGIISVLLIEKLLQNKSSKPTNS